MSRTQTALRTADRLLNVLTYPATLAHECTHAAAARPFAERVTVDAAPKRGHAGCRIVWRRGVPAVVKRLVHVAPTLVGILLGVVAFVALQVLGLSLDNVLLTPGMRVLVLGYWLVYVMPSMEDLRP